MKEYIDNIFNSILEKIDFFISEYGFKILGALLILLLWAVISVLIYKLILFLFKKFKIIQLLEKFEIDIYEEHERKQVDDDEEADIIAEQKATKKHKSVIFKKKIKVNNIVAKASSYYIFLLFFRWAMYNLWVTEIEQFLKDLITYLPSLFVWILIGYFGIRFANFIYDLVYHALALTKQKTAKIIAIWSKIIILFFTLMLVLDYTKIMDRTIIDTIFVGFISMLTIAWGLAFWLWWKDIAREVLESLKK